MEDTNERSFLRLASGFAAGIGLWMAGLALVPTLQIETDAPELAEAPNSVAVTENPVETTQEPRDDSKTVLAQAPLGENDVSNGLENNGLENTVPPKPRYRPETEPNSDPVLQLSDVQPSLQTDIVVAAAPDLIAEPGAILPAPQPSPERVQEVTEVATQALQSGPAKPQTIVEVRTNPEGNELLIFERPNLDETPPTEQSIVARMDYVQSQNSAPQIYGTAPPPPPQADEIAQTLEMDAPVLAITEPVEAEEAPEAPKIVARVENKNKLEAPIAPIASDAPLTSSAQVEVSVNSFGRKLDDGGSATAGLLAAVTGANNTPRQAQIASVLAPRNQTPEAPDQNDGTAPPSPPIATGPAFEAFAAPFDNQNNKSLMAVILIDPSDEGMDRNFLLNLSFPVTFAIPGDDPRARFIEADYRAKGFEVLAMVPSEGPDRLNKRSKSEDVAPVLQALQDNVPSAIGVIDHPEGGLHLNSRIFAVVASELAKTGRAVLTNKQRINNSDRVAKAAGIPFAKVLRPIDADGSEPSIRRALERASLAASQSGGSVVIGRSEPKTVKTIYEWLLSNSARSVEVAPVSAVIKRLKQN